VAGRRFDVVRGLIAVQDFRRLIVSQAGSGLAEWLATMALMALVWDRTHSAVASGMVLAVRILPAAVVSGALGAIVDRFERRRVLVACTLGRAAVYATLPFLSGLGPILALALVAEVGTLAYAAARDATLPSLVPHASLSAANAISMGSAFAAMPVGSGLFAGLMWVQSATLGPGAGIPFFGSALLFTGAATLLRRLSAIAPARRAERAEKTRCDTTLRSVLRADPILRRVVVSGVIVACCGGSLLTLGLAYVRGTLHAGQAAYGGLLSSFCAGAVIGIISLQRFRGNLHHVFHAGAGSMGAILLAMALFPSLIVGYGMGFVFGGAFVATFLGGITILQDRIHDAVRGRAFAFAHSGLRVGAVVAGLASAWCAKMLGAGNVLWTMDGTQVMLGLAGLIIFSATIAPVLQSRTAARAAVAA